jgi:hypothetical protein
MATRTDLLKDLAGMCRQHPYVALGVLAWISAEMTVEELQAALDHAQEVRREWVPLDGHLALVEERYGRARGLG